MLNMCAHASKLPYNPKFLKDPQPGSFQNRGGASLQISTLFKDGPLFPPNSI